MSEKAYISDKLKSTSFNNLFFNYLVDSRCEPVALGAYSPQEVSTTVFLVVSSKRMNTTFEALHHLGRSSFRPSFFSSPIEHSLPSECLAYLSKGIDKASHQKVSNREKIRRTNLECEGH